MHQLGVGEVAVRGTVDVEAVGSDLGGGPSDQGNLVSNRQVCLEVEQFYGRWLGRGGCGRRRWSGRIRRSRRVGRGWGECVRGDDYIGDR